MSLDFKATNLLFLLTIPATLLAGPIPSDCEVARDRAKSKYGAVRHYFDAFNRCVARTDENLGLCRVELDDQQSALGDFIFAQRDAQDVCGAAGQSGEWVQQPQ